MSDEESGLLGPRPRSSLRLGVIVLAAFASGAAVARGAVWARATIKFDKQAYFLGDLDVVIRYPKTGVPSQLCGGLQVKLRANLIRRSLFSHPAGLEMESGPRLPVPQGPPLPVPQKPPLLPQPLPLPPPASCRPGGAFFSPAGEFLVCRDGKFSKWINVGSTGSAFVSDAKNQATVHVSCVNEGKGKGFTVEITLQSRYGTVTKPVAVR